MSTQIETQQIVDLTINFIADWLQKAINNPEDEQPNLDPKFAKIEKIRQYIVEQAKKTIIKKKTT